MDPNAVLYDLALLMYERPGLLVAIALLLPLLIGVIIDRTGTRPTGAIERPPREPVEATTEEAPASETATEAALAPEPAAEPILVYASAVIAALSDRPELCSAPLT